MTERYRILAKLRTIARRPGRWTVRGPSSIDRFLLIQAPSLVTPHRPALRIACLAWGSLIWKHAPLVLASGWHDDGPLLPIEFGREGDAGELATALCPGRPDVRTLWALLAEPSLANAREQLRLREKIPVDRPEGVGSIVVGEPASGLAARIASWAERHALDAVVWTALPARSANVEGRLPPEDEVIDYLDGLTGVVRAHAEDYVRRTPLAIRTPYRDAIERRLGWTSIAAAA